MAAGLAIRIAVNSADNKAKTPPLSRATKILCFDLEANGLHGPVFAAGAVVVDGSGKIFSEFTARCDIKEKTDTWVKENVLPVIADMPVTHKGYKDLRQAFWEWYLLNEPASDYVLVSNGYPVEYRFLIQCQEDDIKERYWQHPFPMLDLASLAVLARADCAELASEIVKVNHFSRHHPLHDARVTVTVAFKLLLADGR